jgi:multidrug efflux system membrane fusion protein
VEAYDRANIAKIGSGTLATVDNQIDPTTGSLRLRADFDNSNNQLFPNQFVNVRLLVEEKSGVVLVSRAVIQRTTSSTYVYVVKADQTATVRQITEGVTEGDDTEITSGLEPGDIAVMTGVDKLQEGTPVTVQLDAGQGGGKTGAPAGAKSGGQPGSKAGAQPGSEPGAKSGGTKK